MATAMAHFVPSVGFLRDAAQSMNGSGGWEARDVALQRALFEDEEEEAIDAPLGAELFAYSPFGSRTGAARSGLQDGSFDEAGEEQWLDEVGALRDQIEYTRRSAEAKVRRTEVQAARLAEVMSRTADGRVAAARRWAAREANKHETLMHQKDHEWAEIVAQVKVEVTELQEDLRDARTENARLQKQLANAALRTEKERRAAEKAQEDAVSQARQEATALAAAKYDPVIAASDERARRAETRLASAAADWTERLAAAEARETQAVDLRRKAEERVAAKFTKQLAEAIDRANAAEKAQQAAEQRCIELEKKSKEEELRRVVGREAAVLELQTTQAKLEQTTAELSRSAILIDTAEAAADELRAQLVQKNQVINDMVQRENDQQAELAGIHEQLKRSEAEASTLGRLYSQRSAELALLSERQNLRWTVYRRIWIRMCCRLLIGARSDVPLFALADSTASDTDTESEGRIEQNSNRSRLRRPLHYSTVDGAAVPRKRLRPSHARTLGRQRRVLSPVASDNNSTEQVESLRYEEEDKDVRSPELEPVDLEGFEQHQHQRDAQVDEGCADSEVRRAEESAASIPAEPTNIEEAEQFAAWQLEHTEANDCTTPVATEQLDVHQNHHRRDTGTNSRTEAIFPLLERNSWLLAVLPLVMLLVLTPLVVFMTPEVPPRVQ